MLNAVVLSVLESKGKVTLPALGTFIKMDIDQQSSYLFTPVGTKADPMLLDAIKQHMEIEQTEVEAVLDSYILFVKNIIERTGKYHLKGVGDIVCQPDGVYTLKNSLSVADKVEMIVSSPVQQVIVDSVLDDTVTVVDVQIEPTIEELEHKAEEIIEDKKTIEQINEQTSHFEIVKEISKMSLDGKSDRLNEKFNSRRLGEVMESNHTPRFVDTLIKKETIVDEPIAVAVLVPVEESILPQIDPVVESQAELMVEPVLEPVESKIVFVQEQELEQKKKTSLSDIYGGSGAVKYVKTAAVVEKHQLLSDILEKNIAAKRAETPIAVVEPKTLNTAPVADAPQVQMQTEVPQIDDIPVKKKTDWIMVISISVIIIGIGIGAYYWLMQRAMEQLK